ncbi:trehalose/maltose ABC transporter permease [Spirochaetia bacterium]|nr:trehalose/maltose ABC transporter permease [Spirochaetia bacterium]
MGKKKHFSIEKAETRDAWIMMSPTILILLVIAVYPVLRTFWISLHEMVLTNPGSGFPFIGIRNYINLLLDRRAWESIWFTSQFTVATVSFELLIGFVAALVMNQGFRGRGIIRAAILVPWAIPTSVSAMMWKFIYNDQYGLFNDILYRFHIITNYQAWLSNQRGSFMALLITDVWKTAPYMALLILAGLQMIPEHQYEAAKIDGANVFQRFVHITLPNIRSTVLVALLFRTLDAFRVFDLVSVMTGGANNTESVSLYAYNNLMKFLDFGYGSAMAVLIFIVVFIISLIYMRFLGDSITRHT